MTFNEIRDLARKYSRTDSNYATDTEVYALINEAIRQLAVDVHGFNYVEYPDLAASFDVTTKMAINLAITGSSNNDIDQDIVIVATTATGQTGAQVAASLQSQIRTAIGGTPDLTVTWTDFYFTIDAIDSTSIVISSPDDEVSYVDATEVLGISGSGTDSVTGGFPEDCTIRAQLAANVIRTQSVEYDRYQLEEQPYEFFMSPEIQGDPYYFHVRGQYIYVRPTPSTRKLFKVAYKGTPTETTISDGTEDIPDIIQEQYQVALAYWVAAELLDQSFEEKPANLNRAKYTQRMRQLAKDLGNRSTTRNDRLPRRVPYSVSLEE